MKVGLLVIHGMGGDKSNSHAKLVANIKKSLDKDVELIVYPVKFYADFQKNQDALLSRLGKLGLCFARKYIISSLGDVGTIGYDSEEYKTTINLIKNGIDALNIRVEGGPIVVAAHSFGCQMFSCYMWDHMNSDINKNIGTFFSMGCNIPVFVSGINPEKIIPFDKPNNYFKWINFWFNNDLLGYPLSPINEAYNYLVDDIKVRSFIPILSHNRYDINRGVYKRIAKEVNRLWKSHTISNS
jgi:hypothetical protein